jgi:hypothetical protein
METAILNAYLTKRTLGCDLVQGTGYRVQGAGYRVQGTGYRVQSTGGNLRMVQGTVHWRELVNGTGYSPLAGTCEW